METITKTDNELIGNFMPKSGIFFLDPTNGVTLCELVHLEYNTSWDWLMPVVEKIEYGLEWKYLVLIEIDLYTKTPRWDVTIRDDGDATRIESPILPYHKSKIEAVYKTVVEFIKWYNQNKNTL